jgi:hypothetical protein
MDYTQLFAAHIVEFLGPEEDFRFASKSIHSACVPEGESIEIDCNDPDHRRILETIHSTGGERVNQLIISDGTSSAICRVLDAVPPLRVLGSLVFSECDFGQSVVCRLIRDSKKFKTVDEVQFLECNFDKVSSDRVTCQLLGQLIASLPSCCVVKISECSVIPRLFVSLLINSKLSEVTMDMCEIADIHISELASTIRMLPAGLRMLSLESNKITDEGFQSLKGILNTRLETLMLESNDIRRPDLGGIPPGCSVTISDANSGPIREVISPKPPSVDDQDLESDNDSDFLTSDADSDSDISLVSEDVLLSDYMHSLPSTHLLIE